MIDAASPEIKEAHKINRSAVKKLSKEFAIIAYKAMLESGAAPVENTTEAAPAEEAAPVEKKKKEKLYKKKILKKGAGKESIPKKGTMVKCHYEGRLEDGTVFDRTNRGKKGQPLSFKVGLGKVIRGWDEAVLTMSLGEVALITIESEWAYGKKGVPEAKIPPNARLVFELELVGYD
eukprot:TRINITY_DN2356_c0_g1_i1.p1 TRINITY_DN2356_c0_g1~~TRINITY_DN2356_c0_g1_i1.p1  ORF type:complete len:177 (-),score=67.63 TRINITY_DN2356_c0_g1_i1:223-753(-)